MDSIRKTPSELEIATGLLVGALSTLPVRDRNALLAVIFFGAAAYFLARAQ